jgi:hypothetical protein
MGESAGLISAGSSSTLSSLDSRGGPHRPASPLMAAAMAA